MVSIDNIHTHLYFDGCIREQLRISMLPKDNWSLEELQIKPPTLRSAEDLLCTACHGGCGVLWGVLVSHPHCHVCFLTRTHTPQDCLIIISLFFLYGFFLQVQQLVLLVFYPVIIFSLLFSFSPFFYPSYHLLWHCYITHSLWVLIELIIMEMNK